MDGQQFRAMLHEMLPREVIAEGARRLGVQERQRKLDPIAVVWSLILSGGTEDCGRLASALRTYVEEEGTQKVAPSAFYSWFDTESLALMQELAGRCCRYAESMPVHLPGILSGRRDWRVVDSTIVRLPRSLVGSFPGTGDYASLKVHKLYSLGVENVVDYHVTEGKAHDGPQLQVDETWRGMGLLADLGYASFRLLRQCLAHDVHLVLKLKEGWKVFVDETGGPEQMRQWLTGCDFAELLSCESFVLRPGQLLDIDVTVGPHSDPIALRLVSLPTDKGDLRFLTNLPRTSHDPEQVGQLYRLRWNIELDNKLGKSAFRLDQITARSPVSAEILIHAAMMAAMLANAFAHADHVQRGFVADRCPRLVEPPLHPMLVAKAIARGADKLASMLCDPDTPLARWEHMASAIRHLSKDTNWRRKPSILDIVKGRTAPPGRSRKQGSSNLGKGP